MNCPECERLRALLEANGIDPGPRAHWREEPILEAHDRGWLTVRAANCMMLYQGCRTLGDIAELSERDIRKTKGCGAKTTRQILTMLEALREGREPPAWGEIR